MSASSGHTGRGVVIRLRQGDDVVDVENVVAIDLLRDESGTRGAMFVKAHFSAEAGQRVLMDPSTKVTVEIDYTGAGINCIEMFLATVQPVGDISISVDAALVRKFILSPTGVSYFAYPGLLLAAE